MSDRIWVLGAADPEMEAIEKLLCAVGEVFEHAKSGGKRVHSGNANKFADKWASIAQEVYLIECKPAAHWMDTHSIDHHFPGDPGYGAKPEQFMPASSIGQVIAELARLGVQLPADWERGWHSIDYKAGEWCLQSGHHKGLSYWLMATNELSGLPVFAPQHIVLTAAADHCLAAAYRGECPGVYPEELMKWRIVSRAKFQNKPIAELEQAIDHARKLLSEAPRIKLGLAGLVADMRPGEGAPDAGGWGDVPELPEAAAREGIAFIAIPKPGPDDGRRKLVLQAASPELVKAFLAGEGPAKELTDLYGDPARGFAGGYFSK